MQDPSRVSWVDIVGESVVAGMAEQAGLQLTEPIRELLDTFAPMVERESRTRALRTAKLTRALGDVRDTNAKVKAEVESLRRTNKRLTDSRCFRLDRNPETTLPVVTLLLRDLPELVISVPRDYGAASGAGRRDARGRNPRRKLTFGFATRAFHNAHAPGPIPAKIAAALSAMAAAARQRAWAFSIEELVSLWLQTAKKIPQEERKKAWKKVRKYLKDNPDVGEPARKRRKRRPTQQQWRPVDRDADTDKGAGSTSAPAPPADPDTGTDPGARVREASARASVEGEGETREITGDASETRVADSAQKSEEKSSGEVDTKRTRGEGTTEGATNSAVPHDDDTGRPFQPGCVYDIDELDV